MEKSSKTTDNTALSQLRSLTQYLISQECLYATVAFFTFIFNFPALEVECPNPRQILNFSNISLCIFVIDVVVNQRYIIRKFYHSIRNGCIQIPFTERFRSWKFMRMFTRVSKFKVQCRKFGKKKTQEIGTALSFCIYFASYQSL